MIPKVVFYKGERRQIVHTISVENLHGYLTVRNANGAEEGHLEYYWVENHDVVMIYKLYVAPEYRRQGVATDLVCFLLTLVGDYRVEVLPSADEGITQRELENFYSSFSYGPRAKSKIVIH